MNAQFAIADPSTRVSSPSGNRTMYAEQLIGHLTSLSAAADIVDAIRDSRLQASRGWNLTQWQDEPMPWGIRFLHRDKEGSVDGEVRAVADVAAQTANLISDAETLSPWPTTVVNLK